MTEDKKSQFSGYMLIAVFVVPLLIAIVMYSMRGHMSISAPKSHGSLIHPAQPIEQLNFVANEKNMTLDEFQGKWTYVLFVDQSCNLECEAALFKIRQSRLATGREVNRVQSFLMHSQNAEFTSNDIQSRFSAIKFSTLKNLVISDEVQNKEVLKSGNIYLIDPNGNLMMKYDDSATSKGLLKDIKKLLKISNIG